MAKINVIFDTETGMVEAKIGDKPLNNINYISFGPNYMEDRDEKPMMCSISMVEEDEENDYKVYTSIVTCSDKSQQSEKWPGFKIENSLSKGASDLAKAFAGRK